jgi:uncharacterized protein YcbX
VQALEEVAVSRDGLAGDRCFFFAGTDRTMVSATRIGPLMAIEPAWDPVGARLELRFPDGSTVAGPVETGEAEQIRFFGLGVDARPVAGPFSEAVSRHCGVDLQLMTRPAERPAVDRGWSGAVTLLGSGSMARLEQAAAADGHGEPIDRRRFRMNFNLEGVGPHGEDDWVGRTVRIGEVEIQVEEKVGRCAATTRDPDRGDVDLKTLHYLASYRREVPSVETLPFGVYASVTRPGTVRIGDPVTPVAG